MKIAGIIAEYNPFHNGHAWHVDRTRGETGCDYVIACMAGHFTQRGEPACLSKWARTRMALSCGVDAVFELPALFAVRPADAFARGGVSILDGLGVDCLSFGSETGDLAVIRALAGLRDHEPREMSIALREKLASGMSHARAWGEAAGEYLGLDCEIIKQPNLVLAVEYLRAMDAQGSAMIPVAIERRGGYHDASLGAYASASAIREAFARGETEAALEAIPDAVRDCAIPDRMHALDDLTLYRLRDMNREQLASLPEVGEGLEHRLYRLCRETGSRETLLEAVKCKRYTRARLNRTLTHALLCMDKAMIEACPTPTYARLLGMRADAEPLLTELKSRARLPVVSRAAELRGDSCFALECRATDLWALAHDVSDARRSEREYTEKFVRL